MQHNINMTNRKLRSRRSFIFTPALKPAMFEKALLSGSDIVCVELEDGIAPKDKKKARENALKIFENYTDSSKVEQVLRVNCIREKYGIDDIVAVIEAHSPPPVLMLPKVNNPEEIFILDKLLDESGHNIRLHIIIETNSALQSAFEIAVSSPRIDAIFFGGVDMAAELRCENSWEALLYARSRVVHAAAAAGLDVIDVPYLDLEDSRGLIESSRKARQLGFSGKGAIHPKQIDTINQTFTPSEEEINKARRIVNIFEEQQTGLVVVDGKLIEKPVLREMYRIIAIADLVGS